MAHTLGGSENEGHTRGYSTAPFSNFGFKAGPCQIAWSSPENTRFAKFRHDLAGIWQRQF